MSITSDRQAKGQARRRRKQLMIWVEAELKEELDRVKRRDGIPISVQVRRGIDLWLKHRPANQAVQRIERHWMEVPAELLRRNKSDAVLLLRLGAFANVVQGLVQRLAGPADDDLGAERDRTHLFLASIGYLKEAVDHIRQNQLRIKQLMSVARRRGYPLNAKWTEMRPLVTTGPGTLYDRVLKRVRHNIGFQLKRSVFVQWIEKAAEGEVRVWEILGSTSAGQLYRASSDALVFALDEERLESDPKRLVQIMTEIRDAQLLLLRMTEAAVGGFMFQSGLKREEFFRTEEVG